MYKMWEENKISSESEHRLETQPELLVNQFSDYGIVIILQKFTINRHIGIL